MLNRNEIELLEICKNENAAKWLGDLPDWRVVGDRLGVNNNTARKRYNRIIEKVENEGLVIEDVLGYGLEVVESIPSQIPNEFVDERERLSKFNVGGNVIVIGDTHLPFELDGYLEFCLRTQEKYKCDTVIHVGDLVDNHASSYHESDPDGYGAKREMSLALEKLQDWTKAFPKVDGLFGNHDLIPSRKVMSAGLSQNFLKSFEEAWELPLGWTWHMGLDVNGVNYVHGTGNGGLTPALNRAKNYMSPVVSGHIHTSGGAFYHFGLNNSVWGLNVGCGIERDSYAMAYGKHHAKGFALGCGVVLEGNIPLFVPYDGNV